MMDSEIENLIDEFDNALREFRQAGVNVSQARANQLARYSSLEVLDYEGDYPLTDELLKALDDREVKTNELIRVHKKMSCIRFERELAPDELDILKRIYRRVKITPRNIEVYPLI